MRLQHNATMKKWYETCMKLDRSNKDWKAFRKELKENKNKEITTTSSVVTASY